MMVARSLALVPIDNEDFPSIQMDAYVSAGMLWGITEELHLDKLEVCINDMRSSKTYMVEGWDQMWRLNSEDINNGMIKMLNALDMVPNLQEDCMNANEDWTTLDNWLDIFFHPFDLIGTAKRNLRNNVGPYTETAELAQEQLDAEEWFEFGRTFGAMTVSILTP